MGCIAAVLPGHITAALAHASHTNGRTPAPMCPVMVPVSLPAPAKEGEARGGGFVHSHWECI